MPKQPVKLDGVSAVRTAVAALFVVAGLAWLTLHYLHGRHHLEGISLSDGLKDWNWIIGLALFFVGLVAMSHPRAPLGRGRGIVIGMLGCFLIGLAWIVLYYFTANDADFPVFSDLGQLNVVVGIAFIAVGFVFATKWE